MKLVFSRMELWRGLQEELNRLYEMFIERNPYFEANGGKVSIVAHSLGCVITYDILTGWNQDVEHSWYNLQTGGVPGAGTAGPGGPPDPTKRMHSHPHNRRYNNNIITPAQSGTSLSWLLLLLLRRLNGVRPPRGIIGPEYA